MINLQIKSRETKWQLKTVEIARNFIFKLWRRRRKILRGNFKVRRDSCNKAKIIIKELFLRVKL